MLVIHVFWRVVGYSRVARVVYAYSSFKETAFVQGAAISINATPPKTQFPRSDQLSLGHQVPNKHFRSRTVTLVR
jgi:hypothetical protein